MTNMRALVPLFITASILLAGNGLQGTFIALRAIEEGFPASQIGLMGAAYFTGFLFACIWVPQLVRLVGHIRVFSALAAVVSAAALALMLLPDPYVWVVLRFASGFCFSGLFTVIESWLNQRTANDDRGRVLSIYRLVDLISVTGAQLLLPVFGTGGTIVFVVTAMAFSLSLVPISLADRSRPAPPESFRFDLKTVWRISPNACLGVFAIGMTNSAFRLIGPVYAREMGLDVGDVVLFLASGILGGAVLQYPLGWMSDRIDRRWPVVLSTSGAVVAGLFLSFSPISGNTALFAGAFVFGAFALPLYSLSLAHANDRADPSQMLLVSAGLLFIFSIGATIGPLVASVIIQRFGPPAFFIYTSTVHAALIVSSFVRMAQSPSAPSSQRSRFVSFLRTSPVIFRLANRNRDKNQP
ncbi:MAG: MFS transporter [Alphaproteobacteria bacterium]